MPPKCIVYLQIIVSYQILRSNNDEENKYEHTSNRFGSVFVDFLSFYSRLKEKTWNLTQCFLRISQKCKLYIAHFRLISLFFLASLFSLPKVRSQLKQRFSRLIRNSSEYDCMRACVPSESRTNHVTCGNIHSNRFDH